MCLFFLIFFWVYLHQDAASFFICDPPLDIFPLLSRVIKSKKEVGHLLEETSASATPHWLHFIFARTLGSKWICTFCQTNGVHFLWFVVLTSFIYLWGTRFLSFLFSAETNVVWNLDLETVYFKQSNFFFLDWGWISLNLVPKSFLNLYKNLDE